MKKFFKAPAYPLVTVDPFFSIWSCADKLTDDTARSWTELPNPIIAGIIVDSKFYSMVATDINFGDNRMKIAQTDVKLTPLSTEYTFENEYARVTLTFTTPLLLKRIDILSRPVSYVAYEIEKKCDKDTDIEFVFGISARCCVRSAEQKVVFKKTDYSVCCGNTIQNPLAQSADKDLIDWGYLHLCDRDAFVTKADKIESIPLNCEYNAYSDMPYIATKRKECNGVIALAYDEIFPIEYFNVPLKEYYTNFFEDFSQMVKAAVSEYDSIKKMCDAFDVELIKEAEKHGEDYKNILTLAYRQAISAHKLISDENGELLFLSKECESNGCIGTLDVTYPSIPLFLKYNPELVIAMLRPIIKYAKTDAWEYEFAPHDVGQYPLANGQVYGMRYNEPKKLEMQMPVEESGNMLLCLAAVMHFSGDNNIKIYEENKGLIKKWADYLVEYGYDPGSQLCTDDFAGHLNHNCNLSLKAILGIASFSRLSGDKKYMEIAKECAERWEKDAKANHGATRLTFDNPDGWSLKYNIVWDNLLGLNLFSEDMKQAEIELYKTKINRYGVPLDSREDYTKIDWLMWSTKIADDSQYFEMVCESIVNMLAETTDRVPLTDWYYTSTGRHKSFQNRTVVGGLYINLLD